MTERKDEDYLERFLRQELSKEEQEELSRQLEEDDELARTYAEALAVQESMRNKIKQAVREQTGSLQPGRGNTLIYYGLGFLAVLLLSALVVFLRGGGPEVEINKAEGGEVIARIVEREKENLPIAGPASWQYLLYQKRYDEALAVLDSLLAGIESPCENLELRYYAGLLNLYARGNPRKAQELLECTLGPTAEQSFRPDVPLHLCTLYALEGEREKALGILEEYQIPRDGLLPQVAAYLF